MELDEFVARMEEETRAPGRITARLVNSEKNRGLPENAACVPFIDLSVVFRRVIRTSDDVIVSAAVTVEDAKRWGMDMDTMYKFAVSNTERMYPCVVSDLCSYIDAMYDGLMTKSGLGMHVQGSLFIVTNQKNCYGASTILCDGVLDRCAGMADDDIYLIPSSVHEMLFLRRGDVADPDDLRGMIFDANRSVVTEEEFLSDSVYLYKRETGELSAV